MNREHVMLYKCKKMLERITKEARDQLGYTSSSTIIEIERLIKDIEND